MFAITKPNSILRAAVLSLLVLPIGAMGSEQSSQVQIPATENIIPNGDFSQGNTGFTSPLPYRKPSFNCLWEGYYTIAPAFNKPQLHTLIAAEAFPATKKRTGKEMVFYANAGGTDSKTIWQADVKCEPNTQYTISFDVISLSGHTEPGTPPRQVPTMEWVPDFEIVVDGQTSPPYQAGCGKYNRVRMTWNSRKKTTATVKIVRAPIAHGGGLIGISNIEMVPVKSATQG